MLHFYSLVIFKNNIFYFWKAEWQKREGVRKIREARERERGDTQRSHVLVHSLNGYNSCCLASQTGIQEFHLGFPHGSWDPSIWDREGCLVRHTCRERSQTEAGLIPGTRVWDVGIPGGDIACYTTTPSLLVYFLHECLLITLHSFCHFLAQFHMVLF